VLAKNLRLGFAIGNLIPALVLGFGCYSLPLRWWGMDVPVTLVVLGLLASSGIALRSSSLGLRALRVAAVALLVLGLGLLAAFALGVAFLSGIHGPFGAFGSILMGLVVFLIAPYAVVYPAVQLWWLGRAQRGSATGSVGSAS
jgi:hypothetical protein